VQFDDIRSSEMGWKIDALNLSSMPYVRIGSVATGLMHFFSAAAELAAVSK